MRAKLDKENKFLGDFPELSPGGVGRICSKHFFNLVAVMDNDSLSLLSFLIGQSEVDNTIKYTGRLMERYKRAVKLLQGKFGKVKLLRTSLPSVQRSFKWLIKNKLVLPTEKRKIYLINPNLAYSKLYVKTKFYDQWIKRYRSGENIEKLSKDYLTHVRGNL